MSAPTPTDLEPSAPKSGDSDAVESGLSAMRGKAFLKGGLRGLIRVWDFLRRGYEWQIALAATGTIALGSLLAEDALPQSGGRVWPESWPRIFVFLVFVAVLLWRIRSRRRHHSGAGTLYYVRLLAINFFDRHREEIDKSITDGDFLDIRAVTQSLSPPPTAGETGDWEPSIRRTATALQATMNDDRIDSGFVFAPNVLWPASMAVGGELFIWSDFKLREVDATDWSWKVTSSDSRGSTHARLAYLTSRLPTAWRRPVPQKVERHVLEGMTGTRTIVVVAGTDQGKSSVNRSDQYSSTYLVGVTDGGCRGVASLLSVTYPTSKKRHREAEQTPVVDPNDMARTTAEAIVLARHESAVAVEVTARLPKTVATAVGWLLANKYESLKTNLPADMCAPYTRAPAPCTVCNNLWEKLVPLHWVPGEGYRVLRIHPLQSQHALREVADFHAPGAPRCSVPPEFDTVVNLTPHPLTLRWGNREIVVPSEGVPVRLDEEAVLSSASVEDPTRMPVHAIRYTGMVSGLPDRQPGQALVVSRPAAAELTHRRDVFFPYPELRDESGRIVGAGGLAQFPRDHVRG